MDTTTAQSAAISGAPSVHVPPRVPSALPANDVRQPWIRSPLWDGCWIFSGMWAPVLCVFGYLYYYGLDAGLSSDAPPFHQDHFVLFLTSLGVLHRLSSIHAVVLSPILKQEVRANPRRYVAVPLAIVAMTMALALAFTFHPAFAFIGTPSGQLWAFYALAIAVILWDRWHFAMQEFGVLSIYRARATQTAAKDRRFDRWYVVALMLVVNSVLYLRAGFGDDLYVLWGGTGVGAWYGQASLEQLALLSCVGAAALIGAAVLRELRHGRRSWPKLLYYLLIGSHTLILYFVPRGLSLFFLSYVFHHWMVAVGLFNRLTLNSYAADSRFARARRYVMRVGPWLVLCVLASLFFAPLDFTGRLTPLPTVDAFADTTTLARVIAGLAIGAFFAFSFLHYYYDRCLYSFSVAGVRRAVGPLLFAPTPTQRARLESPHAPEPESEPAN